MVSLIASRLAAWLLTSSFVTGCAVVLDIEQAELDRRDASMSDSSAPEPDAAAGDAKPTPSCTAHGEACNDCVAASCCGEYTACLDDALCNKALVTYGVCSASAADGGGSSCAEKFGTANAIAESLVRCAFLQTCSAQCAFKPLRSSCASYCSCMAASCPEATYSQGTCEQSCPLLTDEQIGCRAYHCEFATLDPAVHCQHAEGIKVCP